MNKEDQRALVRRVAGLEEAVCRLQLAMGGIAQSLEVAVASPIMCDNCGIDVTGVETCPHEPCSCGFPITREEESNE